jgi:hypothetical protein
MILKATAFFHAFHKHPEEGLSAAKTKVIRSVMLLTYEGESLNNRNFIIPFLQEYLQKLFVPYFST